MAVTFIDLVRPTYSYSPFVFGSQAFQAATDEFRFKGSNRTDGRPDIWSLVYLRMVLNTDATVITRYPTMYLYVPDGTSQEKAVQSAGVAASQTGAELDIMTGMVSNDGAVTFPQSLEWVNYAMDSFLLHGIGALLKCTCVNGQAGDSWNISWAFKYMNYQWGIYEQKTQDPSPTPPTPTPTFPDPKFN